MTLGVKVRELRAAKGLNREGLAVAAGVSFSTLERVERDVHLPTIETLRSLADALGVPLAELVDAIGSAA